MVSGKETETHTQIDRQTDTYKKNFSVGACVHPQSLSYVQLLVTLWTVAHLTPLSTEFSRQKYSSGLHFLLQGIFPNQGSNQSTESLAL